MGNVCTCFATIKKSREVQSNKSKVKASENRTSSLNIPPVFMKQYSVQDGKTITERDLIATAQTGDLLLFTTNHSHAKMIRTITRSRYDHVAMVVNIPLDPLKLHFIESVSNQGVRLQTWDRIKAEIGKRKHFKKVIFRKVNINRDQNLQSKIDEFLDQAIGHEHNINSLKLLKRLSDHRKLHLHHHQESQNP